MVHANRLHQGRVLLVLALAASLAAPPALAQSPTATITGTVTDEQGAAVPGVAVVARHLATNRTFSGLSSQDGVYVITSLPVGRFEVAASLAGFKSFKRTDVALAVGERLRVDVPLQLGGIDETITVSAGGSRVQTEETSLGATVERERVENLPLNGRHVFNLVKIVPGVQPRFKDTDGFAEVDNQRFSRLSFNGGPLSSNQFFLDGGMNMIPAHYEISVVPMVDAVEEFRVISSGLPAEYGQTSGGAVTVVTKAGTNNFRGSAWGFYRDDSLDARNAFATTKPKLDYKQFGATVGGPVFKNKTFFFAGFDRWDFTTANINQARVPTPAERRGDFSSTRDGLGNLIVIYDPATTRPNPSGSGFVRDPFPGNIIPANRMDPLALRLLQYMPLPNSDAVDPSNLNNYRAQEPFPIDQDQVTLRLDHTLTAKVRLFARYTETRNTRKFRAWGLEEEDADTDARDDQRNNHNAVLGSTFLISPRLVNEFRASLTRQNLVFIHPSFGGDWPRTLGFPAVIPSDAFPPITIAGMLAFGSGRGGFAGGYRKSHVVQVADSLTLVRGRHTFKVGTDQRWIRLNFANRPNPSGSFMFQETLTNNPQRPAGTGFGFATFLLGQVSGGSQSVTPAFAFHAWSNGTYVQDDWKVNRRLTLNLGLRYDLASGPVERWDKSSNFDPFVINPETGRAGALLYAGETKDRHFVKPPKTNFGPRLGFAYDLTGDGKTALRGYYGLLYGAVEPGDMVGDSANSLGFSTSTLFLPPGLGPFAAFRLSEGPASLNTPLGPAGGPSAFRGQDVRYQQVDAPTPKLHQWYLTVQRELPASFVITTAYVGNRGVHLFGANYDLNQLDPQYFSLGLALQDQVPNPFFGQITSGPLAGRTVARSQLLRPYPDYLTVSTLNNHGNWSRYHSLQVSLERRAARGLSAMFSYTLSRLTSLGLSEATGNGQVASPNNFRVGRLTREQDASVDESDVTHRFVASAVWELPIGKGRRFLSRGGVLSHILGGWQLNTIVTLQGGNPLSIRGTNNFTQIPFPDLVGDPTLPGSERSANRWFNTDAFRNPAPFTVGNVPRMLEDTRGPGYKDVALSLFKNVHFNDHSKLELRIETFNAFNFVNYGDFATGNVAGANTTFTPNAAGVNTNANFGRITTALPARRIQLGARVTF
jgi:outer membrane receptor protein involved in Fe transport